MAIINSFLISRKSVTVDAVLSAGGYKIYCVFYFSAYQNNDINEFEKILRVNRQTIMEDPFIREHIEGMCTAKQWHLFKMHSTFIMMAWLYSQIYHRYT